MDPSRIFFEQDLQEIDRILDKMIAALYSSGITSEKLKEDVLIRSMISNETVNSIALLRPSLNASGNNSFSFMRLAEPIVQENERIEAVILLTFCEPKFLDYLNVMEYLFNFIQDKEKARKILAVSNFDSLKELLVGRSES